VPQSFRNLRQHAGIIRRLNHQDVILDSQHAGFA
jgi:hypothetical protein